MYVPFIFLCKYFFEALALDIVPKPTNVTYFGMHIHQADQGTAWPIVKFGSWRLWDSRVAWTNLEPQAGKWDFVKLDRYVAMAKLTKTEILLPFGLTPTWASARPDEPSHYGKGNAAEPRDIELWRNYVRTVAERYKGRISHYEILNEVNDPKFYSGTPEMLVKLTCEARKILTEVDPLNQLACPSVTEVGRHLKWHEDFLRLGGGKCVDTLSHHFYVTNEQPEGMLKKIRAVREIMAKFGVADMPLWNTETGWYIGNGDGSPSDSSFLDANWTRYESGDSDWLVARALILARGEGIERFYWYSWDHKALGLIEPKARTLKPGAEAFGRVFNWLFDSGVKPCEVQSNVWSCGIYKDGISIGWVAWSTRSTAQFVWPGISSNVNSEALSGIQSNFYVSPKQALEVNTRPTLFKYNKSIN